MSLLVNDPISPLMGAAGLAVGGPIGSAAGGRITRFAPKSSGRSIGVEIFVDPPHPDWGEGHVMVWINGKYNGSGSSGVYRATRLAVGQDVRLDAFSFPPHATFRSGLESLLGVRSNDLRLTWNGDAETSRYEVFYSAISPDNLKRSAIIQRNTRIKVENVTANGAEVTVIGMDGIGDGTHSYLLSLSKPDDDTLTIYAENTESGESWGPHTRDSLHDSQGTGWFRFGSGLSIEAPDPEDWPFPGVTEFSVVAGPERTHLISNTGSSANHYFQVKAFRGDGSPGSPSAIKAYQQDSLPSMIDDVSVEYTGPSSVEVSFTLPMDATGWKLYHSWPEIPEYEIVWPIPRAVGTATPGSQVVVPLSDLSPGRYSLLVRSVNDNGRDDESDMVQVFYLTTSGISFEEISKPIYLQATPNGIGRLIIKLRTNGAEDRVALYSNGGQEGEEVDYGSPWLILMAAERDIYNRYEIELHGLTEGFWTIGARTRLGASEEGNSDVQDSATIYGAPLHIPYGLEVVPA